MKPSQATRGSMPAVLRLLEQHFAPGATGGAPRVPAALWNQALIDPLRDFLGRSGKELRGRLLVLGVALGGGEVERVPPELPLLIEVLHAGSLIIDDIEDDSPTRRGAVALHRRHGLPVALNARNWLYFWAQSLLARAALPDPVRLAAYDALADCLVQCHEGQALDLTVRVDALAQAQVPGIVAAITDLKTGCLTALATGLGAIAAEAGAERRRAVAAFGRAVGVGLQMLDDLSGLVNARRRQKAVEDLVHGRATWVWAWLADDLPPPAYQQLRGALHDVMVGAPAEPLIERLRFGLAASGVPRARTQLAAAVDDLRAVLGDGDWCATVRAELAWLEREYVDA